MKTVPNTWYFKINLKLFCYFGDKGNSYPAVVIGFL